MSSSFGNHLKQWRNKRRYSQLDLAIEADVSQRHISFLESGRAKPSREMILRLSQTLDLPLDERNELLTQGGFAPLYAARSLDSPEMQPLVAAMRHQLDHHNPYPAIVVDHAWNLLMSNSSFDNLLEFSGDAAQLWHTVCPSGERNVLKLTLHPLGLRAFCEDWQTIGLSVLQRLNREAKATQNSALSKLFDELLEIPGIPQNWRESVIDQCPEPVLKMRLKMGEIELSLMTMIATFGTPQDVTVADLRLELFYPCDDDTAAVLKAINSSSAATLQ